MPWPMRDLRRITAAYIELLAAYRLPLAACCLPLAPYRSPLAARVGLTARHSVAHPPRLALQGLGWIARLPRYRGQAPCQNGINAVAEQPLLPGFFIDLTRRLDA